MTRSLLRTQLGLAALIAISFAAAKSDGASMKTIQGPQGGEIRYGQVDGQSTEAGAMGATLRSFHSQYGERPEVGKLFEVRGTRSVAAFFSVKKSRGAEPLAGLIIVTKTATDHVEAGVVADDASRFPREMNSMMKALFGAWHPFDSARTAGGSAVAGLHKFTLQDRSASVDLPDNWKVQPSSGAGTILAERPQGETAAFGSTALVADLNNPRARQTYETVQRGGLRNTVYANGLYYALNGDLGKVFVDLTQLGRRRGGLGPATIQIGSVTPVSAPPNERCAHITANADMQDSKGIKELNLIFCVTAPAPASGGFLAISSFTAVPKALADKERPTLGAVLASFSVDQAVVQRMAHAYAAPAIEAIHAVGRAAAAQAAAAHEREAIHNSSVYQHWDDMDRRGKEFSNYLLGYSVVEDIPNHAHGTFWNEDADALVRSDPQRYEYVNAPNFWKGIDY